MQPQQTSLHCTRLNTADHVRAVVTLRGYAATLAKKTAEEQGICVARHIAQVYERRQLKSAQAARIVELEARVAELEAQLAQVQVKH